MGYYEALCDLLRPLGVYDMEQGRFQLGELLAAGAGLDAGETALEAGIAEASPLTATPAGLERWERLMEAPLEGSLEARRSACGELLRICDASFTPADMLALLRCWDVKAALKECPGQRLEVHFGGIRGIPPGFERIRLVLERIVPCQLELAYCFLFLVWDEFDAMTWDFAGQFTWDELIVFDPEK